MGSKVQRSIFLVTVRSSKVPSFGLKGLCFKAKAKSQGEFIVRVRFWTPDLINL